MPGSLRTHYNEYVIMTNMPYYTKCYYNQHVSYNQYYGVVVGSSGAVMGRWAGNGRAGRPTAGGYRLYALKPIGDGP